MYLVTVLPIKRSIQKETLTYFSKEDFKPGSAVSIPLRSKNIQGIVVSCENAEKFRSEIKKLPFEIKKIERKSDLKKIIPEYIIKSIKECSLYHASNPGEIIASIIPEYEVELLLKEENKKIKKFKFEELAIQTEDEDRLSIIKGIVRETLGKKESIQIFTPTKESAKKIFLFLSKGIEEKSIILTNGAYKKNIKKIESLDANLVVSTPNFCGVLKENTSTILIEEESSPFYKSRRNPYLDARIFLREIAKNASKKIFWSDVMLSLETINRINKGEIIEFIRSKEKIIKPLQTLVVDISKEEGKEWSPVSTDLKEALRYCDKKNKKIFIYGTRSGIASYTVCVDCRKTVLCERCSAPTVLHKKGEGFVFICHHCGKMRDAHEKCKYCDSWNLKPLGIGIQKIEEEIKQIVPESKIFIIDKDHVKNLSEAKKTIQEFLESKKGILIGTEIATRLLEKESVEYVAIASLDSLFAIPNFKVGENIIHLLLRLKNIAKEILILQTRDPKNKIIDYGLEGNIGRFAKEELAERKTLGFPPFKEFVKLSIKGKKEEIKIEAEKLKKLLSSWEAIIFPAFIKTVKNQTLLHVLLTIPKEKYPDIKLSSILASLPPNIKVEVAPNSLL